jgi:hypothetical protein
MRERKQPFSGMESTDLPKSNHWRDRPFPRQMQACAERRQNLPLA